MLICEKKGEKAKPFFVKPSKLIELSKHLQMNIVCLLARKCQQICENGDFVLPLKIAGALTRYMFVAEYFGHFQA